METLTMRIINAWYKATGFKCENAGYTIEDFSFTVTIILRDILLAAEETLVPTAENESEYRHIEVLEEEEDWENKEVDGEERDNENKQRGESLMMRNQVECVR